LVTETIRKFRGWFEASRYNKIIEAISEIISEEQELDPDLMHILCASYFKVDNIEKALEIGDILYPTKINDIDFIALYGAILRRAGRPRDAISIMNTHVEEMKNNSLFMNNYANILMDIGRVESAEAILVNFVSLDVKNINDIKANLDRLEQIKSHKLEVDDQIDNNSRSKSAPASVKNQNKTDFLFDPLLEAFSDQHKYFGIPDSLILSAEKSSLVENLVRVLMSHEQSEDLDEKPSLLRKLLEVNPEKGINLAISILSLSPSPNYRLYDVIGEHYIDKQEFSRAYVVYSTLCSIEKTSSRVVNMVSLSAVLNDYVAARYWFSMATEMKIDADILKTLKNTLDLKFSNIKAL